MSQVFIKISKHKLRRACKMFGIFTTETAFERIAIADHSLKWTVCILPHPVTQPIARWGVMVTTNVVWKW
jgi:hypothetical protein